MIAGPYPKFQEAFEAFQIELREELHEELEAFKQELLAEIKKTVWTRPGGPVKRVEGYKPPTELTIRSLVRESSLASDYDIDDIEGGLPPKQPEEKQSRQLVNLEDLEREEPPNRFGSPPRPKRTIGEISASSEAKPLLAHRVCTQCLAGVPVQYRKRNDPLPCPRCGGKTYLNQPLPDEDDLQEDTNNGYHSGHIPSQDDTDFIW